MTAAALELAAWALGATEIVRGVDLRIERGERHALIGPNGAGKSVLFHLISARFPLSAGRISLHGETISGKRPYEVNRRGLSRSFQVTNLFHRLSVLENVRCAVLWPLGYRYSFWRRVERLADVNSARARCSSEIGLAARADRARRNPLYAEQRALEIGITIAGGADVILLDEPTAGMSRTETEAAVGLIRRISQGTHAPHRRARHERRLRARDRISVLVYGRSSQAARPPRSAPTRRCGRAYLGAAARGSPRPPCLLRQEPRAARRGARRARG
jgi:branched-chain amino acid transport system ATP-binding protein